MRRRQRESAPIGTVGSGSPFVWVLLFVSVAAVGFELGRMDVLTDNEGQRATPPVEMVQSGDYVIPRMNGLPYLVKPPLLYWAIAGVYELTGVVSEATARIPTAASFVLVVLGVYWSLRRDAGEAAGRMASLMLVSSPYLLERARWANLDVPLTCALFFTTWLAFRAVRAESRGAMAGGVALAGVAFGAALLLKGPPAALFLGMGWLASILSATEDPRRTFRFGLGATAVAFAVALLSYAVTIPVPIALIAFVTLWAAIGARFADRRRLRVCTAVFLSVGLIGAALAAPWAVAVVRTMGWDYIRDMLDSQVMERTYVASRINSGDPFYYLYNLVGMAAPWSLLLPLVCTRSAWRAGGESFRLSVLVGALGVGVFSVIAGKEREYALPAVPFLLMGIGMAVAAMRETSDHRPDTFEARWFRGWLRAMKVALPVLACGVAAYYAVTIGGVVLIGECVALLVVGLGSSGMLRRVEDAARPTYSIAALALTVSLIAVVGRGHELSDNWGDSPKQIGLAMRELLDSGATIEATPPLDEHQPYPYQALAFYVRRTLALEIEPALVRQRLVDNPKYYYLTRERFAPLILEAEDTEASTADYEALLGPASKKDLVLIGTPPLPQGPAVDAAVAANAAAR